MRIILAIGILCSLLFGVDAQLEIVKNLQGSVNIAIESNGGENAKKISKTLSKDLEVSGSFKSTLGDSVAQNPNYLLHRSKNINLLAQVFQEGQKYKLKLYDVLGEKLVLEKNLVLEKSEEYPFIAHKMAIAISDAIGAPSIKWMEKKVVFAKILASSKSAIVVADYSLTYQKTIINDGLNVFPKWADSKQTSIYFTKYLERPTILKYDLKTKKYEKLLSSPGIAIVSDVSNDGKKLLVSMSPITQSDIYLYDTEAKTLKRLTNYPGIDVGANFVEKQNKIIFISDRLGYPNVFLMNQDGSQPAQVVFHGKNNSSVTSNGEYVVYSSRETKNEFGRNIFNLYLIDLNGSQLRRLTLKGVNQMPRFSQDGENVMFLKNDKQSALGIIRLRYNKTYLFPISNLKIQSFDW